MLSCRFQQWLGCLPSRLAKGLLKRDFLNIYLNTFFFWVGNIGNISPIRVIFYFKMFQNQSRFKNCGNKLIKGLLSFHVTYTFQIESTLYSFLNVKKLLARSRCEIWSLSAWNWTRTQKHLVRKWTLKWLSVHLRTKWFWVRFQLRIWIGYVKLPYPEDNTCDPQPIPIC